MSSVPDQVAVRQGETVHFIVIDEGRLIQALVLGTPDALKANAAAMEAKPGMRHDGQGMVRYRGSGRAGGEPAAGFSAQLRQVSLPQPVSGSTPYGNSPTARPVTGS